METWYRTGGYGGELIEPVDVVKSTDKTVTLAATGNGRERRSAINSGWHHYFRTWEEAHAYLLEKSESKVLSARRNLELANGQFGNVRGMKKPA